MNTNHHNEPDILESALSELRREGETLGPSPQALARTREAIATAGRKPPGLHLVERIRHMRNWKKSLSIAAAAAVVIIAAAVWMNMPNGSVPNFTDITFADVQRQMHNIKTMSFMLSQSGPITYTNGGGTERTITMNEKGEITKDETKIIKPSKKVEIKHGKQKARIFLKEPDIMRVEVLEDSINPDSVGTCTIVDSRKGKAFFIIPKMKAYGIVNIPDSCSDSMFSGFDSFFQDIRNTIENSDAKPLGEKTVDGRKAMGYEIKKQDIRVEVWADAETGMPIRMSGPSDPKKGSGITTMSNIRINAPLDDSLFSMKIPKGYKNIEDLDINNFEKSEKGEKRKK